MPLVNRAAPAAALTLPLSRTNLTLFLAVSLGITSVVAVAATLLRIQPDEPGFVPFYIVGLLSPFAGALLYLWRTTGSLHPLVGMYWPLRLGAGAIMVIAVPVALAVAYLAADFFGAPVDWRALPPVSVLLLAFFGWSSVMWAEETAWRGTLLPALQARFHPIVATLLVNLVWVVWHLPFLALLGMSSEQMMLFSLQTLGLSFAMTWAWNRSGTALVPVLVHGAGNAAGMWLSSTVPSVHPNDLVQLQAGGTLVLGALTILLAGPRLGFPGSRSGPASAPEPQLSTFQLQRPR